MDPEPLPERIDTRRLTLRRWRFGDEEALFAYASDEMWARYLGALPQPYLPGHAEAFVARQVLLDGVTHAGWAVVAEGDLVGGVNLRLDVANRVGELGYSVARAHWNRGYASEAVGAVMDAAFTARPELNRIRAMADARNDASQKVMKKLGMRHEGVLRQNRVERGELVDEAWYGILRSEWDAKR